MVGQLNSYQDIYVARCGEVFASQLSGRKHENNCRHCSPSRYEEAMERADYERDRKREEAMDDWFNDDRGNP